MVKVTEKHGEAVSVEARLPFAELLALPVPLGPPTSPCTATVQLPPEFDVLLASVAAVAQETGLDLGDYGRVTARLDGTDVVYEFPPRRVG